MKAPGQPATDFALPDPEKAIVRLSDLHGRANTLFSHLPAVEEPIAVLEGLNHRG